MVEQVVHKRAKERGRKIVGADGRSPRDSFTKDYNDFRRVQLFRAGSGGFHQNLLNIRIG